MEDAELPTLQSHKHGDLRRNLKELEKPGDSRKTLEIFEGHSSVVID